MKIFLSTIFCTVGLLFCSESIAQQLPNSGFENWRTTSFGELPAGASGVSWSSNDSLIASLGGHAPNKAVIKVTDAHSGNYALCIQESYIHIPATNYKDSGGGILFLGNPSFITFKPLGVPYTSRPNSLSGYYKLTANVPGADTSQISATFKLAGATIGIGEQLFYTAATTFQPFTIPITWTSSSMPDKLEFFMGNGGPDVISNDTSTRFYVDDLMFNFPNGLKENLVPEDGFKTYPNPATEYVIVQTSAEFARPEYSITIHDVNGKLLNRFAVTADQRISLKGYAAGTYFFQLRNREGDVVFGNRINVIK